MKLTYFSVQDFRSIAKARIDNLQSAAILIGPNNEGKSNVLQGLRACLTLLRAERSVRLVNKSADKLQLRYDARVFDWASDFPIRKQLSSPTGESIFELHFQLSDAEKAAFLKATGSKLNEVLPIQLSFSPNYYASFKVLKQGRGGAALTKKSEEICRFISNTLDFVYVPAVRTADASLEVVNELVSVELRQLEKNPRYTKLQEEISGLQRPLLDALADKLKTNLKSFIGDSLKDVSLHLAGRRYMSYRYGRDCQITIDDGTPTLLERKGDGVQSLVAISLMTGMLQSAEAEKDVILLIEEPESHLHPKAIHQLRDVLESLRQDSQLIISTHCPLLVNRAHVAANLIVSKNKAAPATSLRQLREILGVRTSDNLEHAALVVVVEGPEDEIALSALLPAYSKEVGEALSKGSIAFHTLGGASKLPYSASLLQSSLCNYYILLDDDAEGRRAFQEAESMLLVSAANTSFTKCLGLMEAEFEDLLAEGVYVDYFRNKYSVDVQHAPFNTKNKWSKRIRYGLTKAGKSTGTGEAWSERDEYADKREIAKLVAANPETAINPAREEVLKAFVTALESKLKTLVT